MIVSAYIQQEQQRIAVKHTLSSHHKCILEAVTIPHRFVLVLNFDQPILQFRNHDYRWISAKDSVLIPEFSNKILQIQNGSYVQGSTTQGIWEWHPQRPKELLWHFHPEAAESLTVYSGVSNIKTRIGAQSPALLELPSLLFSNAGALEVSRTPIPFVGTVCFTDHCDYDTPENLKTQRDFLQSVGVKVTKGFFLQHYSKRETNASWQNQSEELQLWAKDGHELAYHSLSQSIKSEAESRNDFLNFNAPLPDIPVWIDHGFQPYNWSLYQNSGYREDELQTVMQRNGITVFWNYMDTGRAAKGIINMLNRQQFTLQAFRQSIQHLPFLKRIENTVKAIVFYAYNHAHRIRNYIDALSHLRLLKKTKHPKHALAFLLNVMPVFWKVISFLGSSKKQKNPFPLAEFSPIFFRHQFGNQMYTVFQSVELVDFVSGLSKENIDMLRDESGVLIAHTYFAVDMTHHQGRLLESETQIAHQPGLNFRYLGEQIAAKKLWNPTLSQLIQAWEQFSNITFDVDAQGEIIVSNGIDLPKRLIR